MSELKNRIRLIRKSLELTQEDFSSKIGIKRNTLANYEIGRNIPIDAVLFSIVREFNVNEKWLRTGEGQMFIEADNSIIEQLVSTYKLDDVSRKILETFLELTDEQKAVIGDYFKSLSLKLISTTLDTQTQSNNNTDIELELARYRMELEAKKNERTLSASEEQKHD